MRGKGEEEPLTGGTPFIAKRQLRAFRARSGSVLPFQYFWLCHRKWLMLFSLKFQKNNQKNTLVMDSADGNSGEKGYIFTSLWR